MSTGFVYRWIDSSNGKYYIGSHKGDKTDKYKGSGILFKRAYRKRKECFSREILYSGVDFREVEDLILKTLDVENDKNSYNMKNSAIGGRVSDAVYKKQSLALKGKALPDYVKNKVSYANTRYSLYCALNDKTYFNVREASIDLDIPSSKIRSMLNGYVKNKLMVYKIKKIR